MKKLVLAVAILGASICNAQIDTSKYDYVYDFSEGLALVKLSGKYGFINTEGKEIIPFKYDYAYGFFEGVAKVKEGKKWYIIDTKGKKIKEVE